MTVNFSHEELSFLASNFGYKHLEGLELIKFDETQCTDSLLAKGYIVPYKKTYELSNELRILFSAWVNIQYTIVRANYVTEIDLFAVFASRERIITYSYHSGNIQMSMCDFSFETMDMVIRDYLDIKENVVANDKFNVSFTADEYLAAFGTEMSNEEFAKTTGLKIEDVELIKYLLSHDATTSYVLQDVVQDISCRGIIFAYDGGYMLLKHIVPNNNLRKQKVVIAKGSAKDIVDSIYIL